MSGLFLAGCGESEPWLERPVESRDVLDDLLIITERGDAASPHNRELAKYLSEHLVAHLEIPDNATLLLDGRISKKDAGDPRAIGPAHYSVEVNGREIFSRSLVSSSEHNTFEAVVPLDDYAGEAVDLEIRIRNKDLDHSNAYWGKLLLQKIEPISRRAATAGPNLLFIVVDTLRADHTSLYGYHRSTTPFLEELGRESLVFEQAVSPASWTLPAVASLMTGLQPPRHGAVNGGPLGHRFELLAELFQKAGLTTVAVSANPLIGPAHGFSQGIEEFHHRTWARAPEINDTFKQWVADKKDLQWFAYLHYIDPHDPYDAPAPEGTAFVESGYEGIFARQGVLNKLYHSENYGLEPAVAYSEEDVRYLVDAYDGEILYWDRHLRELVEHLRSLDLWERTIVVLLSDHGEEFADHQMWKHGHQLYDETVRVPLLIRDPRLSPARLREPVETRRVWDAALQLLGLADEPPGPGGLLDSNEERQPVFSHTRYPISPDRPNPRRGLASLHMDHWKLIHELEDEQMQLYEDSHQKRLELYDLSQDPQERHNLAGVETELADQLRQILRAWLENEKTDSIAEQHLLLLMRSKN